MLMGRIEHITALPRWRSRRWLMPLLLAWLGMMATGFGASFTATLDRETVEVGESATLTLNFEGGQPNAIPSPPNLPSLHVENGGISQHVNIINGAMTATVSQSFSLTPTQPGTYLIPAIQVQVGGETLSSQPLKLTAVKSSTASGQGNELAFMKLVVPRKEVYVGEVVPVELQVYIRADAANLQEILAGFDNYGGTPINGEGLTVLKTAHAQRRQAHMGNANYGVATLVTAVSPVKTGELTIKSFEPGFNINLPLPGQAPRDPFGFFQRVETRKVLLSADPLTLTAIAVPKENMPPTFNGAVGSYSLAMTAGPTNVAAGDPITTRIQISGRGALDSLTLPEQPGWSDFKTYPPTTSIESSDPLGLQGTKTFEQLVVPQSSDIKSLPPVTFSFFDPEQKAYRTLSQPGIPIVVKAVAATAPPVTASSRTTAEQPPLAMDIVGLKLRLGTVETAGVPLIQRGWFLGLQLVPILAWLSALGWRRRNEMLANNPRLRRQRQVAKLTREGLGQLHKLAEAKKSEEFFALLCRLLQEQIGERLNLPANSITEAVVEEQLRPRKVPDTVLGPVHELFQAANLARYAPVRTTQELEANIPKLEAALKGLQGVKL